MTNGDHEEARRLRSQAIAAEAAQARKRLAPLRKVVLRELAGTDLYEALECGHEMVAHAGLFGGHLPRRRRCLECLELLEAAVEEQGE